jgi:hypothetical protein
MARRRRATPSMQISVTEPTEVRDRQPEAQASGRNIAGGTRARQTRRGAEQLLVTARAAVEPRVRLAYAACSR